MVFWGSFKGISNKLHRCFMKVRRKIDACFEGDLRVFQGCFKGVSRVFQGVSKKFNFALHSSQLPEQKEGLFYLGGSRQACLPPFPRREKANEKLLGSKNLFSESWSERPYNYREVISILDLRGPRHENLLGLKNLFCESLLECPYYYQEVIFIFWFWDCMYQ